MESYNLKIRRNLIIYSNTFQTSLIMTNNLKFYVFYMSQYTCVYLLVHMHTHIKLKKYN